jgi:ABC-type multidrug transport system fused ATPase/permease subunit
MRDALIRILKLGRRHGRGFVWVALLVSFGTMASLLEPWIYRAVVDDIAGVFVTPAPLRKIEGAVATLSASVEHLPKSGTRIFRAPLRELRRETHGPRRLKPRTAPEAVATVVVGGVLLVLIRWFSELCSLKGDNRVSVLANGIESRFILDTFHHVLRLPLGYFSRRPSGTLARQIDQSDQIAPVFTAFAQEIWPNVFRLVAIFAIVVALNWQLALIALIALPAYAFVSWRMSRRLETQLDEYYGLWDDVSGRIQEALAGIKTVLASGTADHEYTRLQASNDRALRAYIVRNQLQNRYSFLQELIVAVAKAGALVLGGIKALQHQLTPGDVVLFVSYLDQLYMPIQDLTSMYTSLQEHVSSVHRAEKLLSAPEAPGEDQPPFRPGRGEIEFRDVRFAYRPGRPVLEGISFRIEPGQHVGLIGPSGAGKTTLTDLLIGLYPPQSGEILIDGQAVTQVSPSSLRRAIRGVATDGVLFRMSIADNIRYGRFDAGDDEVQDASRLAGLEPLLERLPEGLATPIGERGAELSAGERQRVLLARAFLARPTVLILDEATANLDFRTEESVKAAMQQISHGRTTIIVAHRKAMLTDVDRVLVLRRGVIEQDGPPAVLIEQPGYFRDMMRAQER